MKNNTNKTILFIPPNGKLKRQDFSLQRLARYFQDKKQIKTILLHIQTSEEKQITDCFDKVISVSNETELLTLIKSSDFDLVFHRTWMHAYQFAANLIKHVNNVVVNIKDWNFSSPDVYQFLFGNHDDFEAIRYIFQHSRRILSHYSHEQTEIWAKEYAVDANKFLFFPEYCNEEQFLHKQVNNLEVIRLVYAGKILPASLPEEFFPAKSHLRSISKLTKNGIQIDFVLPENEYLYLQKHQKIFKDYLFHHQFNANFSLLQGKALEPEVLTAYHFGFFELECSGQNEMLYRYAVTSKFAFYLEAGLPLLVNEKFKTMSSLVNTYQIGIVFNNDELDKLQNKLKISPHEYQNMVNNVRDFRKNFLYSDQILNEAFFSHTADKLI